MHDPLTKWIENWENRALEHDRFQNPAAAAEVRRCAAELRESLALLVEQPVAYEDAAKLTGYSRGSLENRKDLQNIGTRRAPAFRLGSLPVKRIERSPSAAYLLHRQLDRLRSKEAGSAAERRAREKARRAA